MDKTIFIARKARPLALDLADALTARLRDGELAVGHKMPTESAIMGEFGVSRTVVREALSKLQARGLVQTRQGIGSFVTDTPADASFRLASTAPDDRLHDVAAVLELRLGVEAEAAALAATRRSEPELQAMQRAQSAFERAVRQGADTAEPDRDLHLAVARATRNAHFMDLLAHLGHVLEPNTPIDTARLANEVRSQHLMRVHAEHDSFVSAIANRDPEAARAAMRTHLANSRERLRRADAAPLRRTPARAPVV